MVTVIFTSLASIYPGITDRKNFETREEADAWIKSQGKSIDVLSVESTGVAAMTRIFG